MSLILIAHDARRAVLCADDQITDANFEKRLGGYPKFAILRGGLIFACSGRASISGRMIRGTQKLVADRGPLSYSELCGFLQFSLRKTWEDRQPAAIPADKDNLAGILLGFDSSQKRIRCTYWFSRDDFAGFESTAHPLSRILCDGYWDEGDRVELQALTDRMRFADDKKVPWIAAELRKSFDTIRQRHPNVIGPPCHFAALDRNGPSTLPKEFPAPVPQEYAEMKAAAVCATIDVAAFSMRIPGIPDIEYASGSISGLAYNALYYVYTDDPGFQGGAVVYEVTTDKTTALDGAGREFIGSITTPVQGAGDTTGNGDGGAGAQVGTYQPIGLIPVVNLQFGSGAVANLNNASTADVTSPTALTASADGTNDRIKISFLIPGGITFQKAVLNFIIAVPTNTLSAAYAADAYATLSVSFDGGSTFPFSLGVVAGQGPMQPTVFQVATAATHGLVVNRCRGRRGTSADWFPAVPGRWNWIFLKLGCKSSNRRKNEYATNRTESATGTAGAAVQPANRRGAR